MSEGWIEIGAPFDAVLNIKRELVREFGPSIGLLLLPQEYRTPRITMEEARATAESERTRLILDGWPLEPLQGGFSCEKWFEFNSPHRDWQAQDLVPGAVFIYVDKISGRISAHDEVSTFREVQSVPRQYKWDPELWGDPNVALEGYRIVDTANIGDICAVRGNVSQNLLGLVGPVVFTREKTGKLVVANFVKMDGREFPLESLLSSRSPVFRRYLGGWLE